MKIALCGYMGSGKTEVGKLVSKRLQMDFYDLDQTIETAEEKDIFDIFHEKGEIYFRKQESLWLGKLLSSPENCVISLGGGTPCYGDNIHLLKTEGVTLIYLKMDAESLTRRLFKEKETRPMISHYSDKEELEEFVRKHLFERNYYYLQSNIILEVGEKSPENIVEEIATNLRVKS